MVTFFGATSAVNTSVAAAGVDVPVPASIPAGALMLMAVSIPSTTTTITVPAAWTEIALPVTAISTQARLRIYSKVAGVAEGAPYRVDFSVSSRFSVAFMVYLDCTIGPFNSNADAVAGTTHTGASITTTVPSSWYMTAWSHRITGNVASWTPQSPDVERKDIVGGSTTAAQVCLMIADSGTGISPATFNRTATTPADQVTVEAIIALTPLAGCALTPAGIDNTITIGHPTIEVPPPVGCALTPAGISNPVTFGIPTINAPGEFNLVAEGISNPIVLGHPTIVAAVGCALTPAGIDNTITIGHPTIEVPPPVGCVFTPEGIDNTIIVGKPTIVAALPISCHLTPIGIPNPILIGHPTISVPPPVGCVLTPAGIGPLAQLGRPSITRHQPIKPCPKPGCVNWNLDPEPCCPGWDDLPVGLRDSAITMATDIMFALSGRRYRECWATIRPCKTFCLCCGSNNQPPAWWSGSGRRLPYIDNRGQLRSNCGCECNSCCSALCAVYLDPGPALEICTVRINGVDLDSSLYQVLDGSILVMEEAKGCFPDCQNLALPDTEPGTWSITYKYGLPPPAGALRAASVLACELAKACSGAKGCRLPARVQQLTRDGVTIQLDPMDFLDKGRTGIVEIDSWLAAVNPYGLAAPAQVWSPDTDPPHRVTWPR